MKTFFVLFALSLWLSSFAEAQVRVKENIRQRSVDTTSADSSSESDSESSEKASPKSSKKKAVAGKRK